MTMRAERGAAAVAHFAYLARIAGVYARPGSGPLSFWHESPEVNDRAFADGLEYFMRFQEKATYRGPFDRDGIPLLDYGGDIGRQQNPIAIAQYGLARFNCWVQKADAGEDRIAWTAVALWLTRELRPNSHGLLVWMHDFDWPYRQRLNAPWYSGLAQGNGLSMLIRAARVTRDRRYAQAADAAFESFRRDVTDGGVMVTDADGDLWIEEYLVDPPSHILNGFMWALWGVYDYWQWSGSAQAKEIWERCVRTLIRRVGEFDTGWWSLYEARDGGREMLASRYYHELHITQLRVLHRLTGNSEFGEVADRFQSYLERSASRCRAFLKKAVFKLSHY